jgi:Leucine-rich repeat (LRR) protein
LWATLLKEVHSDPMHITNINLQPHETLNSTFASKTTTEVVFLNSTLYTIPKEIFTAMPKLKSLSAVSCQIQGLYAEKKPQANKLRKIDLSLNQISQLYADQFAWAMNLNNINLSHNVISEMSENTFGGLIGLTELDLSWNQLKVLPSSGIFRGLSSLKRLKLGGNQLSKINQSNLIGLDNLKTITLDFNQLTKIDNFSFKQATGLVKVILSNNQISLIEPKAFLALSKLNNLMLTGNKLKSINDVMFPVSLERLYLNNNDLVSIMFGTSNVKSLDLSNNPNMQWQTHALASTKNLQYVNISDTNLSVSILKEGLLKNLKKIIGLDMSDNDLKTISFEWFSDLKNLKYLHLNKDMKGLSGSLQA